MTKKGMYTWFYKQLRVKKVESDDTLYLLSDSEILRIKKRENRAIFWAAFIGVVAVLALYLPQYYFPEWFPLHTISIPILEEPVSFSITAFLFGMVLVFIEILILTFLNIYSAHDIAVSSGYLTIENKNDGEKMELILGLGQEKKNKKIKKLGIDPYAGLNKSSVFLMTTFFTLKATLSNIVMRLLIQKIMGRYAVREVLDMLGIPIFAFWNAVGTRKVLRQARIVLMGIHYLEQLKNELSDFRNLTSEEKILLYDTLSYIAISKRDYHNNHYLLSKMLLERFSIDLESNHTIGGDYFQNAQKCAPDFKELNEKVILLGFALDGSLSLREKRRIKRLKDKKILQLSVSQTNELVENFVFGKGLF